MTNQLNPRGPIAMKTRVASLAMLATSVAALSAGSAFADQARPILDKFPERQAYHQHTDNIVRIRKPGASISQWKGSFKDHHGTTRTFVMIGPDPAQSNTTTTIPFEIVPVVFKYAAYNNETFDPKKDTYSNGQTVLKNLLKSPLIANVVKFKSGGQALGKTQYINAYQRGNFWNFVKNNPNYNVVLGTPTVLPSLKITVQSGQGVVEKNPFGTQDVGTYGFGPMDTQINNYIAAHNEITPDTFVFFVSHNIFLTSGGCCIGGYHYSTSTQTSSQSYGYTTLVTDPGSFSQDVSAASHEIGEWMDDPYPGNNNVGCNDNGWMENGDPLEGRANYGAIGYTVNGFTYNLQDLVYIDYFGAPDKWPVKSLKSFNQLEQNYCPGQ
jgi:hypothetical protein